MTSAAARVRLNLAWDIAQEPARVRAILRKWRKRRARAPRRKHADD